jgi:3-methyladenine DNA glycosylase AlkD
MDSWIEDEYLWIRRVALIYQLLYKEETDKERLFAYCEKTMHEKDFFIRKALGWSLRQYAKTNPQDVSSFISKHRDKLSPLSFREASKSLIIS